MRYTPIASLYKLIELATNEDGVECFIALNGGLRSSKTVWYNPETETFDVRNHIDDTEQEGLTDVTLAMETNIVSAIDKGAFYQYQD